MVMYGSVFLPEHGRRPFGCLSFALLGTPRTNVQRLLGGLPALSRVGEAPGWSVRSVRGRRRTGVHERNSRAVPCGPSGFLPATRGAPRTVLLEPDGSASTEVLEGGLLREILPFGARPVAFKAMHCRLPR
jgi:hypothetical protein